MDDEIVEGKDYKIDMHGNIVWTKTYLVDRGYCCGDGCLYCPYVPKHKEGNKTLKESSDDYYGGPG